MLFTDFKRDVKAVRKVLDVKKDESVSVKEDLDVYIQKDLEAKLLLDISVDRWKVFGNFLMVANGKSSVMSVMGLIDLEPTGSFIVDVAGVKYYKLEYKKGSKFIHNLNIVIIGEVSYEVINKYLFYGSVPAYLTQNDLSNIYSTTKQFTKVGIDDRQEMIDMATSVVTRSAKNYDIESRHAPENEGFISLPLSNVNFGKSKPFAKMSGSYQKAGLVSATLTELDTLSNTEEAIRK